MQLAMPSITPCVKRILLATAAVFLLQFLLSFNPGADEAFTRWFAVYPPAWKSFLPAVWQVLTYGFLHSVHDMGHVVWNMLWLYFLGTMLEGVIGGRRFLAIYLGSMLAGGILQLAVSLFSHSDARILGASGAILGITLALATLRPQTRIIFLFIPLTLKTLAIIKVGMDVFGILFELRDNTGGGTAYFAHLGGAIFGFAVAKSGWIWRDPFAEIERRVDERRERGQANDQAKVDQLLTKIHHEGIQSLSEREKAFLKRAAKR